MTQPTPNIDIRPDHWETVRDILHKHVPQHAVWAFGSRATWTAKEFSDLDLAVMGDEPLSLDPSARLSDDFSESDLPYKVDVVDWAATSESFRKIIERDRVVVQAGKSLSTVNEWQFTTVGDFCPFIYGKALPERSRIPGVFPVISSAGVSGTHNKPLVEGGGIVIGRKGTVGSVTLSKSPFWPIDTVFYIEAEPQRDLRFTYYLLKTLGLDRMNSDSAVPGLNRDNAHTRSIFVPPLPEQRAIAHILGACRTWTRRLQIDQAGPFFAGFLTHRRDYGPANPAKTVLALINFRSRRSKSDRLLGALDDKIDLNRRINQTLEAMAQAIFKSWFVDFDPVKAKIWAIQEGRDPLRAAMSAISGKPEAELDALPPEAFEQIAATAALFPEEMEVSELGVIPKGWDAKPLDTLARYLNGLALQKFPPKSATDFLPVIKIAQLRSGQTDGADKAASDLKPEYVVCDGDVLFSWSGSLEVDVWTGGRGALNQHLFKVTSSVVPKWFYLLATKHYLPQFREIAANKATTMGHIQRKHLSGARIATPSPEFFYQATKVVSPLLDKVISLRLQSRDLAKARDTLLPKLLCGELSVASIEAEPAP